MEARVHVSLPDDSEFMTLVTAYRRAGDDLRYYMNTHGKIDFNLLLDANDNKTALNENGEEVTGGNQ